MLPRTTDTTITGVPHAPMLAHSLCDVWCEQGVCWRESGGGGACSCASGAVIPGMEAMEAISSMPPAHAPPPVTAASCAKMRAMVSVLARKTRERMGENKRECAENRSRGFAIGMWGNP